MDVCWRGLCGNLTLGRTTKDDRWLQKVSNWERWWFIYLQQSIDQADPWSLASCNILCTKYYTITSRSIPNVFVRSERLSIKSSTIRRSLLLKNLAYHNVLGWLLASEALPLSGDFDRGREGWLPWPVACEIRRPNVYFFSTRSVMAWLVYS